jgi:hypothetical protein
MRVCRKLSRGSHPLVWKLGILDGRLGLRFGMMHAVFDAYLAKHPEASACYRASDAD